MSKPFTPEQFDALREWIDQRIQINRSIARNASDETFCKARGRELREADAMAYDALVEEPFEEPKHQGIDQP